MKKLNRFNAAISIGCAFASFMATDAVGAPNERALSERRARTTENALVPGGLVPGEDDNESSFGLRRITFDLGASTGSIGDVTYTEAALGVNVYFYEWLAWRNAVFGRFQTGQETITGLDTSLRPILALGNGVLGLTAFGGPGYRFVSRGDHVPFLEGGLVFRLVGLSIGGGVKRLLTSAVRSGAPNDTQYFLILAGGGRL